MRHQIWLEIFCRICGKETKYWRKIDKCVCIELNDRQWLCYCVQLFDIPEFTCYRIDWSWELPSANDLKITTKSFDCVCVCVSFRLRLKPKCIQIARRVCVGWLIGTMALVVGIFAQLHVNWNVETHVLLVHHIHKVSQQQNKNNGRRMFFNIFFPLSEIY